MRYKKILVTGGSGMVGRSLKDIMPNAYYLSSSDCDLTNQLEVEKLFKGYKPDCVIHLAAKVGGIMSNIKSPADYFTENILMNTMVLDASKRHDVKRFISILSSCIFPDVVPNYPMSESDLHMGPPTKTNFSYAYAKRCLAVQTEAYNEQFGLNYQFLNPSNLYGEYDKYDENSHFIADLIKKIIVAKKEKSDKITLFGTGAPLRQFLHSSDLANVILECVENDIYTNMNVSSKEVFSIRQMAEIALKSCDATHLKIEYDVTKPDGQYRKDISITKLLKELPTFNPIPLSEGIKQVYLKLNK